MFELVKPLGFSLLTPFGEVQIINGLLVLNNRPVTLADRPIRLSNVD